jgi:hypothetical protein
MKFILTLFVCLFSVIAHANEVDEMRSILEKNFDACNREDHVALMETCSLDMPDREGFKKESIKLWKEKDIYYRLVKFKVDSVEGNIATATVVQLSQTKDRSSNDDEEAFFRNGTTLLTKDECVIYQVAFKKENGNWKCLATISEPVKYDLEE